MTGAQDQPERLPWDPARGSFKLDRVNGEGFIGTNIPPDFERPMTGDEYKRAVLFVDLRGERPELGPYTPALTAKEWAEVGQAHAGAHNMAPMIHGMVESLVGMKCDPLVPQLNRRHAVAALALHGQPFGFTAADVTRIGQQARAARRGGDDVPASALTDIAQRIHALLPPDPA